MAIQFQSHALRAYLKTAMQEFSHLDIDVRLKVYGESNCNELISLLECRGEAPDRYRFHELLYEVEDTLGRYYRQQGTHGNDDYYLFSPMIDELITKDEIGLPRCCLRQDQEQDEIGVWIEDLVQEMGIEKFDSQRGLDELPNGGFQPPEETKDAVDSTLTASPLVREMHLPKERVLQRLQQVVDSLPLDISQDPRVIKALLALSPLEQNFLTELAVAGDGVRVSTDELAIKCWGSVPSEEAIRSVFRKIQLALVKSPVMVSNARKGYKITLTK